MAAEDGERKRLVGAQQQRKAKVKAKAKVKVKVKVKAKVKAKARVKAKGKVNLHLLRPRVQVRKFLLRAHPQQLQKGTKLLVAGKLIQHDHVEEEAL